MSHILRLLVLLCACAALPSVAATDQEFPATMHGKWEGELRTERLVAGEIDVSQPATTDAYQLDISKGVIVLLTREDDGTYAPSGFLTLFDFHVTKDTVAGEVFRTSKFKGGHWEEAQSFVIHKLGDDTLAVYWLRAVNNMNDAANTPSDKWARVRAGTLRRVRATGTQP